MNKANFSILLIKTFNLWNLFLDAVFMKKSTKEDTVNYYYYCSYNYLRKYFRYNFLCWRIMFI